MNIIDKENLELKENYKNPEKKAQQFQQLYECLNTFEDHGNSIVLSIVIPVFNEERTIKNILERLPRENSIEVIIVDDHSTDDSVKEIKSLKGSKNLRIIQHKKNLGYGSALLTGIKSSKGKIIVTMDSDGQHRPEDILNLVEPIVNHTAEITIGSRYHGTYNYTLPLSTRLGELIIEKFMIVLFGQKVMNNQGGFRAFHRKLISLFDDIKFQGYAFTTEILLKAALKGYRIKECPIHLQGREYGSSKIILNKLTQRMLLCFFYYTLKKINNPYYKKWGVKRILFLNKVPPLSRQKRIETLMYDIERVHLVA